MGSVLMLSAGPAQASTKTSSDDKYIAQAAFCVPCAIAAAALAVKIARAIRVARAARALRAAAALRPTTTGVSITAARVRVVTQQARNIAKRGKTWTKKNWPKLSPYVRACIAGVAGLEGGRILEDGKISRDEWQAYVSGMNLGNTNTSYLDLFTNPGFDFNRPTDGWFAACAVGVTTRGITG
jgi:hypothetical protein